MEQRQVDRETDEEQVDGVADPLTRQDEKQVDRVADPLTRQDEKQVG
jgi:hypothetical protein